MCNLKEQRAFLRALVEEKGHECLVSVQHYSSREYVDVCGWSFVKTKPDTVNITITLELREDELNKITGGM